MTAAPAQRLRRIVAIIGTAILDNWGALLLLGLWELWIAVGNLNAVVMPHSWLAVADVISAPAIYARNAAWTICIAALGLSVGFAFGAGIAIASWFSRLASGFLSVAALIVASVPVVAFIPIIGRLLGYDARTDLAIVSVICFFPFFAFTAAGLKATPPGSIALLTVLGGNRRAQFQHVALPAALPHCMIALRMAAPSAVLAALAAEYLMGTQGLGTMVRDAMAEFDSSRAIGASLLAAVISLLGFSLATRAEAAIRLRYG
jgi:ABC-type nitrate/sulfonate/bicarbonate transport system permease component